MFKRLFWLSTGASVGFGASFWLTRKLRRTVERFMPRRVQQDLGRKARSLGVDVKAAVADGRDAMRQREEALRADLSRSRPEVAPR